MQMTKDSSQARFRTRTWARRIPARYRAGTVIITLLTFALLIPLDAGTAEAVTPDFEPIKQRLVEDGINAEVVQACFADPRFKVIPDLLMLNVRQPSGTAGYTRFIEDQSVRTASAFLSLHRSRIEKVLKDSPVNPEVVVAILQVESSLGAYRGTYPLLNVYASLTLLDSDQLELIFPGYWARVLEGNGPGDLDTARNQAKKRADLKARWAYRELRTLFIMAGEGRLDPLSAKGSWAGAYGLPQFIPTSYEAYGRDGNGDGRVDLETLEDAVASISHYLRIHGYRKDRPGKRRKAVWHYNHSDEYVDCILTLAERIEILSAEKFAP